MKKLILTVENNSIGAEMGIEPLDKLLSIDGVKVADVFDYRMAIANDEIEILIEKPNGEQWLLEIEKDEDEDLGLVFESGLMDDVRKCANNCVFCFIHQNPKGTMRDTIYFCDDDYRLSFLHGNYITLTNMTQGDVGRILAHRLSPINISVHTTDEMLRVKMMGNGRAGESLGYMRQLAQGGIALGLQIVLCKGYNDGEHLDKTIHDLSRLVPPGGGGFSLSVVPAGLTKYREQNGLTNLEPFSQADCKKILRQVEAWQSRFLSELSTRFVYAADELYVKAGVALPPYEAYEDFLQIENGVGMMAEFKRDFNNVTCSFDAKATMVTGMAAYDFMCDLNLPMDIAAIKNDFFGENVTVAGLLTGQDIISQLEGRSLGDVLLLPANCLRHGENVLLDGVTTDDISKALGVTVLVAEPTAQGLANALTGGIV